MPLTFLPNAIIPTLSKENKSRRSLKQRISCNPSQGFKKQVPKNPQGKFCDGIFSEQHYRKCFIRFYAVY